VFILKKFCSSANLADDTDGFCVHFGDFLGVEKPRFLSQITQKSVVWDPPKTSADQPWGVPAGKSPFSVGKTGQFFSIVHNFFFDALTNFFSRPQIF